MNRSPSLSDADFHEGTWSAMAILVALIEHGGWMATAEVATAAGVGRDAARRMLRTFASESWVERQELEGRDVWTIGHTLPRIGLAYQRLQVSQAEALAARHAELLAPFRSST